MARLVLLTPVQNGDVVLAARPRLRDRLTARWRAMRLDSELAAGAAPGPLAARGIAQVRLLLTDGRSPLYFGGTTEDLRTAVSRALADLQPTFGW